MAMNPPSEDAGRAKSTKKKSTLPTPRPGPPDDSVTNRASIILLAEVEDRRILLTGDATAGDILDGLAANGLLDENGRCHVDIFVLPHKGSKRSSTLELFERVTADTYVITADGRQGLPDFETLMWLVHAADSQERSIQIVATNPTPNLRKFIQEYPPEEYRYKLVMLEAGESSLYLPAGAP